MKAKLSPTATMIILIIIGAALTATTFAAINVSTSLTSVGSISTSANLAIYSDSACTVPISSIDWGAITAGGTVSRTVYVKNTGSGVSLNLSMASSNWNPTTANGPLAITWNKQGTVLAPAQSTAATLTLTVSPSISGITNFSVQINITGTA